MENILYCGDNLEILQKDIDKGSIDLIYMDPHSLVISRMGN